MSEVSPSGAGARTTPAERSGEAVLRTSGAEALTTPGERSGEAVLRWSGLQYRYAGASGGVLSLSDFMLPPGGHVLLRGASGSGKSTLLALIAGLLTPTAGRLAVGGEDIAALPAARRDAWRGAHLGFMPQRLHLSDALSVWDNLCMPYVAAGLPVDGARVEAVLRALGLLELADRRPHALSQGQAQRVALARAVLRSPQFILADEPTANLDDDACAATLQLLRSTAEAQGVCLVLASHDARIERAWSTWPAMHRFFLGAAAATDPIREGRSP